MEEGLYFSDHRGNLETAFFISFFEKEERIGMPNEFADYSCVSMIKIPDPIPTKPIVPPKSRKTSL